jgi:hypothetical protein
MDPVPLCFMFFQSQMWAIYSVGIHRPHQSLLFCQVYGLTRSLLRVVECQFFLSDKGLLPVNVFGTMVGLLYT